MYVTSMLGHKFSVVTTNQERAPHLWDAVRHYGLRERCASVRSTGMPVLALEAASSEEVDRLILASARQALEQDGEEVICLGCAGIAGLDKKLQQELNVPVVDGVIGTMKMTQDTRAQVVGDRSGSVP